MNRTGHGGTESAHSKVQRAAEAQRAERFESAEQLAQEALEIDPSYLPAKFLLGIALARRGEAHRAASLLDDVLKADPNSYETLVSLSTIYRDHGRVEEAVALCLRAVKIRPNVAHAHNLLGRSLLAARRLQEAAASFNQAINLQPGFAPAYYNLGKTRQLEGKDGEAADAFTNAAQLAPTVENLLALGQILLILCDFEDAAECGRRSVGMHPDSAAAHLLLCGALIELNQIPEANNHLERAIELDVDGREALQIAARQRPLGFVDEANRNLRSAIEQSPRSVAAYDALMQNQRVTEEDRPLVDKMQALLSDGGIGPTELISIHYGLGKALEDLGEFQESMHHYDEANRITRSVKMQDAPFDEGRYVQHVDRMMEGFSDESGSGASPSELPILIVGMMRSGTTLAEQILSCHPKVAAAGEQLYWSRNWRRAIGDGREPVALGWEYVRFLQDFRPGAERVTDKMPGNYLFLGLIHLALPNARIIHMRRTPADNCLSIWATPNHMPHEGGHDKNNIVFVYKQYLRLMEHWRTVLPKDRFLEVDYEELVSNREAVIRRMVEFCGLGWDEACLRPQENKRMVATPSAWQVRQPVYKTSVERWRKFEPYLGPFRELLDLAHGSNG